MTDCARCNESIPAAHCRPIIGDKQYHAACHFSLVTSPDVIGAADALRAARHEADNAARWLATRDHASIQDTASATRNAIRDLYRVLDVLGEQYPKIR